MAKPSTRDLLRAPDGLELTTIDPAATPGFKGSKREGAKLQASLATRLAELQERLFAEGTVSGGRRSLLLVLQGMDTAGKGGVVKHVVGQVEPMGIRYHAFKVPTKEEREHDFLWRFRKALPEPGMLGVFDRSHYEDVGVVRVHGLVPRSWSRRYATTNRFEERLVAGGTTVVKCFLHISKQEQQKRLLARLDDPTKQWKYNPGDVDERLQWDDYQVAYTEAINRCNTDAAPWYVVPADRKWWRNLAITRLLIESLETMSPQYPPPAYDVDAERRRALKS
jgi:PPK2 family polyphosphate:nucleotide phosphotransferase